MSDKFEYGTGRRKTATARTRVYAGSGNITVNGRAYARRGRRRLDGRFRRRRRRELRPRSLHGAARFDGKLLRIGAALGRVLRAGSRFGRFQLDFLLSAFLRFFRRGRAFLRRLRRCGGRRRGAGRFRNDRAQDLLLDERQLLRGFPILAGHVEEKTAHHACHR